MYYINVLNKYSKSLFIQTKIWVEKLMICFIVKVQVDRNQTKSSQAMPKHAKQPQLLVSSTDNAAGVICAANKY